MVEKIFKKIHLNDLKWDRLTGTCGYLATPSTPRAREPGPRTPKIQIDSFRSLG